MNKRNKLIIGTHKVGGACRFRQTSSLNDTFYGIASAAVIVVMTWAILGAI